MGLKMDPTKLNIRVYNVGLGDCIYIYVPHPVKPGKENAYHILIDCGSVSPGEDITAKALENLKGLLPTNGTGKYHLDLLVISHPHKDHYSGFDPAQGGKQGASNPWFSDFEVERLWFSKLLEKNNPEAQKAREIGDLAKKELARFLSFESSTSNYGLQLNPALTESARSLAADCDLREKITSALIKQAKKTEYLDTDTPATSLTLFPQNANSAIFHVLSPSREIDNVYLGKSLIQAFDQYTAGRKPLKKQDNIVFDNSTISMIDFNNLYNRMVNNVLMLAMDEGSMYNITGLVLLLEWKGYRLLFPGDIEYTAPTSKSKEHGAWNVIWNRHLQSGKTLLQYVDFLKVGHHGSDNASPWSEKGANQGINDILDAIVQNPNNLQPGENPHPCTIVVSTERLKSYNRTNKHNIPYAPLLVELGRRASNPQKYNEFEGYYQPRLVIDKKRVNWPAEYDYFTLFKANSVKKDEFQPQRTDLHVQEAGCQDTYIDEYGLECARYIDFSFS